MQVFEQTLEEVVASLSPLDVDWMDAMAATAIAKLADIPRRKVYERTDIASLFDGPFDVGVLCARLFLVLSADTMRHEMKRVMGKGGSGSKRLKNDPDGFYRGLEELGLLTAMGTTINYQPVWSDLLVERLRGGRGSAISGQKRGRGLEDFVEALVEEVFGKDGYDVRCMFTGVGGKLAKCDVAIPDKAKPRIVIEVKGYGATGSKMTDIIGDLDAITETKRNDTTLLFVTDGSTWEARLSDLRKIVSRQNDGKIARIYTTRMREQFVEDLRTLKREAGI